MPNLGPDYSKRDYLLPPGCKDLIDVLKLEQSDKESKRKENGPQFLSKTHMLKVNPALPKSPLEGSTIEVKQSTVVKELAHVIGIKPFRMIADLMELGIFASVNECVNFDIAARVLAKYGIFAKKAT